MSDYQTRAGSFEGFSALVLELGGDPDPLLRQAGVEIAWLSDLPVNQSGLVRSALEKAGLDPRGQDIISLRRDENDNKQQRKENLAGITCIVAIAGDERADAFGRDGDVVDPHGGGGDHDDDCNGGCRGGGIGVEGMPVPVVYHRRQDDDPYVAVAWVGRRRRRVSAWRKEQERERERTWQLVFE